MYDRSVFFEEWRACLQAHYIYVLRINDKVTEPTLRGVLLDAGFSEAEIEECRRMAMQSREDV
jgi:hypothetical protein